MVKWIKRTTAATKGYQRSAVRCPALLLLTDWDSPSKRTLMIYYGLLYYWADRDMLWGLHDLGWIRVAGESLLTSCLVEAWAAKCVVEDVIGTQMSYLIGSGGLVNITNTL